MMQKPEDELLVLWTSDDKEVARQMVLLYSENAQRQGWWDEVTVLIWGSSAMLVVNDEQIQAYIKKLQDVGVRVIACKACARNLEVAEDLKQLNIDVFYTGELLTDWLKSDRKVLSV